MAHPTRFERVTFAFRGQTPTPPIPEQRIYSIARMGCCKPPATTPQRASLLRAALPCETALWLFHDVDRRRKLKGRARTGLATIRFRDWTAIRLSGATAICLSLVAWWHCCR